MTDDHGGWCCPDNAYCICGQVFDEHHDLELCHRLVPMADEPPMSLTDYIVSRSREYL